MNFDERLYACNVSRHMEGKLNGCAFFCVEIRSIHVSRKKMGKKSETVGKKQKQ